MKIAIKTVVPQPGNTLPASEFNGRKRVPSGVTIPGSWKLVELACFEDFVAILIKDTNIFFTFCNIIMENIFVYHIKIIMESPAFFFTFFLWFLLLSVTGYSVYISFGPPSKKLRDPFEEHED